MSSWQYPVTRDLFPNTASCPPQESECMVIWNKVIYKDNVTFLHLHCLTFPKARPPAYQSLYPPTISCSNHFIYHLTISFSQKASKKRALPSTNANVSPPSTPAAGCKIKLPKPCCQGGMFFTPCFLFTLSLPLKNFLTMMTIQPLRKSN